MRAFSSVKARHAMKKMKTHWRSPKVLGSSITCILIITFLNMTLLSSRSTRRQTVSDVLIAKSDKLATECIVNNGKAVVHDKDTDFAAKPMQIIDSFKEHYDAYKMPEIQTIGPSFYFQTTDPRKDVGKNWPALSRAWNETYAVIDDDSVTNGGGEIWGSKGLLDEHILKILDDTSGNPPITMLEPGKYAAFSGWFLGNFGHYVHDHVSKIAWLKSIVSEDTKFILPHHELHEKILNVVDENFVKERVVWVDYDETVHVTRGSLTVMLPKENYPFRGGTPQTATVFTEHFRQWLEETHWSPKASNQAANEGKVIYYTRNGGSARRVIEAQQEEKLLQIIRLAMAKRGQSEDDLIIFNGKGEDGLTLPMEKQFEIFSSADTAIGPHGSGLTNIIWMDPRCLSDNKKRPKVIEFASSDRTPSVQGGSVWGYWFLFGSLPWIDYHQLYYTNKSTDAQVLIDLEVFEETLNNLWEIK